MNPDSAMLRRFTTSWMRGVFVCLVLGLSTAMLGAQPATGITIGGKAAAFSAEDRINKPHMEYPYEDRRSYHQGSGRYRVIFDPKTGLVRNVTVLKSTGWISLDNAALRGLRQLQIKPGKWKQVDFPFTYTMSRNREEGLEKIRRLRAEGKD